MFSRQHLLDLINGHGVAMGPTDLSRGAYSGKECHMYYNTTTYAMPTWAELVRIRNIQFNDGPELNDVQFHAAAFTSQIPGYKAFNGSLEYVRKRGTDAVYAAIKTDSDNGNIQDWLYINDEKDVDGATGWRSPIIIGEFANTSNGGDPVVETIPFSMADAYDAMENVITKVPVTMSSGQPTAAGIFGVLAAQAMMARVRDPKERRQRTEAIMRDLEDRGIQTKGGVLLKTPPADFVPKGLEDLVKAPVEPGKPGA